MTKHVAVAGCGHWGKNLVRNFHELGALHSICDHSDEIAGVMSAQYNVPALPWDEVLGSDEVKAVVISSPAPFHSDMARSALEAGKDVYVEKPITLTNEDAEDLCALAAEREKVLMVGHLLQYHPAFLATKDLVDRGELGDVQYIYSNRLSFGKVRREENVMWSFAPHDVSMILALAGEAPSVVDAVGSCQTHETIADFAMVSMRFPSGIGAHINVSWINPFKEQKLVVIGNKGMAVFDDREDWGRKLVVYPHVIDMSGGMDVVPELVKADGVPVVLEEGEPLKMECQHFLDCVESRDTPRTDGQEGLRVLDVLNRADGSMRSKR